MLPETVREPDRTWLAIAAYNLGMGHMNGARRIAEGIDMSENGLAMEALRYVGSGQASHYLGTDHTQANFKTAFWRTELLDYKPFEAWELDGSRDTTALASARPTTRSRRLMPRRKRR